jgi:hypothetical protein
MKQRQINVTTAGECDEEYWMVTPDLGELQMPFKSNTSLQNILMSHQFFLLASTLQIHRKPPSSLVFYLIFPAILMGIQKSFNAPCTWTKVIFDEEIVNGCLV